MGTMTTSNLTRFHCLTVVALLARSAAAHAKTPEVNDAEFRREFASIRGRRLGTSSERVSEERPKPRARRGSIKLSAHRSNQLDEQLSMVKLPVPQQAQPNVEVVQDHLGVRREYICTPYTKPKFDRDALLMQKRRQRFEARGGHGVTNP